MTGVVIGRRRASGLSRVLRNPHVGLLLRCLVGGVFVYASLDKIQHPDAFAQVVLGYRMLPTLLVVPFSVLLPYLELVAGGFLILGVLRRGSAAVITALLTVFLVAITQAIARDIDIACGCFKASAGGERLAWETLVRDIALIAAAVAVIRTPRTALELARRSRYP